MSQLVVVCRRPMALSPAGAENWLRGELGRLLADHSHVAQVTLTSLVSASSRWPRMWDDLIAIELREDADANAAVDADECASLLAELRSLGMSPNVVVARDDRTLVLEGARA